jgi:hypothetical protein
MKRFSSQHSEKPSNATTIFYLLKLFSVEFKTLQGFFEAKHFGTNNSQMLNILQ